jgi:hypothetical protein
MLVLDNQQVTKNANILQLPHYLILIKNDTHIEEDSPKIFAL